MTAREGQQLGPRKFGPVTQTDIVRFAGAGGDFNPLHHDAVFAAQAGFAQPIAMGQMTAGVLAAWLTDWCGVENLRKLDVRFTAPLSVGDTVTATGHVVSVERADDGHSLASVALAIGTAETALATAQAVVVVIPG